MTNTCFTATTIVAGTNNSRMPLSNPVMYVPALPPTAAIEALPKEATITKTAPAVRKVPTSPAVTLSKPTIIPKLSRTF